MLPGILSGPRALGGGGGGVWTPADLPNAVSWYRASLGILEADAPGRVSGWQDQIGSNDLEQATPLDQPVINASGINGKPTIEFDGVDQWLRNTAFVLGSTTRLTIVWVGRLVSNSGGARFVTYAGAGGGPRLYESGTSMAWTGAGLAPNALASHGNISRCHILQWQESGNHTFHFGTTLQSTAVEGAGTILSTAAFAIGAYTNGGVPADLHLTDLIVLNDNLTPAERTDISTYSNTEYATAL